MRKVIVRADQDIFDVCLQEFGSLEQLDIIINDNDLPFSGNITQGQELIINSENVGNEDVKDFFQLRNKTPKNGITEQPTESEGSTLDSDTISWDSTQITFDEIITI